MKESDLSGKLYIAIKIYAESLLKPSSAARAIDSGAVNIERVDKLVQTIGKELGMQHDIVDQGVATVDRRLQTNLEHQSVEPA